MQIMSILAGAKTAFSRLADTSSIKTAMPSYLETIWRWSTIYGQVWARHSLQMIVVMLLHMVTIPQMITVMLMITDDMPSLDITLLTWGGLIALYLQHLIQRNQLLMFVNTLGFATQAILCALIFFQRG